MPPATNRGPVFDLRLPVTYGTVVRNSGPEPMLEVRVEHELAAGPRFLSADPPPEVHDRRLVWTIGTLEPEGERRLHVTVLPNHADEIPDDADGLFQVFQQQTSRSRLLKPNVSVSLHVAGPAEVGTPVALYIEVQNKGNGAARDLQFRIPLPEGLIHADRAEVEFTVPCLHR